MSRSHPDHPWSPHDPVLRSHLITLLDHVLWLSQWAVNVPSLNETERQALLHNVEMLDTALQALLAHPAPAAPSSD